MGLFDRFKKKDSKKNIRKEDEFINSLSQPEFNIIVNAFKSGSNWSENVSREFNPSYLKDAIINRLERETYGEIINNTNDEKALRDIAINAQSVEIAISATEKINTKQYLIDIIQNHKSRSYKLIRVAMSKFNETGDILRLFNDCDNYSGVDDYCINKLDEINLNQKELIDFAKKRTNKYNVRVEAIKRITDKSALKALYNSSEFNSYRDSKKFIYEDDEYTKKQIRWANAGNKDSSTRNEAQKIILLNAIYKKIK